MAGLCRTLVVGRANLMRGRPGGRPGAQDRGQPMTGPHKPQPQPEASAGRCDFCDRRPASQWLEFQYSDDVWPREAVACRPCLEVQLLHLERFGGMVLDIEGSRSLGSVFSR